MERRDSGLRKNIEAYEAEENYTEELKPKYKSTVSSFTTILKNLNHVTQNDGQSVGQKLKLGDRRKQIVKIVKTNSKMTTYDLSKQFNVTDRTIKRDLKVLTEKKQSSIQTVLR